MIIVPRRGPDGTLFDMKTFAADIDAFFQIDMWHIQIDWCIGEKAQEIEQLTAKPVELTNKAFWVLYAGIEQTIDGRFIAFSKNAQQCTIEIIDSSCWEICGSPAFERHMQEKYGVYVPS